jgi:uncharacterized protein DUF3800
MAFPYPALQWLNKKIAPVSVEVGTTTVHFLYIDEAGNSGANLHDAQQPVFVMAGLLVSDEKWQGTKAVIQTTISSFFEGVVPQNFELHACELLSPNGDGPFAGIIRDSRNALALDLLNLITQRSHSLLLVPVYKATLDQCPAPPGQFGFDWKHPWEFGFGLMLTMFEEFLRGPDTGRSSAGLAIVDHEEQYVEFVRSHTSNRQGSTGWRQVKKVVEIGYSATSHANPLIQLTDLVAFTYKKYLELETPNAAGWSQAAKDVFNECKESIWGRVKLKQLSFQRLSVPAQAVDFAKAVRVP